MKFVLALALFTTASAALSQSYDPKTEVTFSGKVTGVLVAPSNQVNIMVKTENGGSSLVALGPQAYVNRQAVRLAMKDEVTVTGSKVTLSSKKTAILASKVVKKNGQTLSLRNEAGDPLWTSADLRAMPATQPVPVGGGVQVLAGDVIDLANADNPRLVVSTPEGDVQVDLGPDWYLSNQRSTYTMNELLALNGVFNNIGLPGRPIILNQQGRDGILYLTPYWPTR